MKLIVGLGNPGKEYENTRHNIGFIVIDQFASINNVTIDKKKFNGLYTTFNFEGEKVILLKPQSYINLSGEVIKKYIDFFDINVEDLIIINDDLDLDLGTFKIKKQGSSGGHNGLKNIESHLHTQVYKRVKVGISNNKNVDTKDYVLGKLNSSEKKIIESVVEEIINVLKDYLYLDFELLMSKYNKKSD